MSDKLYQIADNFKVFTFLKNKSDDIEKLKSCYEEKDHYKLSFILKEIIIENITTQLHTTPGIETKIELLSLLTECIFKNDFDELETCAIFSIFWDTLSLSFRKYDRKQIFDYFKRSLVKHSMDRPPYQVNIFKKQTLQVISDWFIETVYKKFEMLKYLLTKKDDVQVINNDMSSSKLPHTLDIGMGQMVTTKSVLAIKNYTQTRRPKTELDMKIETVLDFEREVLDKILEIKFAEQDELFNKRLEEITKGKKLK
jgi:hypothetical protein